MRTGRICVLPSKWPKALEPELPLLIGVVREQADLRRIARRRGEAQMREGSARDDAPAWASLHEALLQEVRLDDLLDGVARLAQSRGDGFDADGTAAEGFRD